MKNTSNNNSKVLYLGFNHMLKHKRGVENVIDFQAKAFPNRIHYYIHWDTNTSIYRYKSFICVGIKNNFFKYFLFNWFVFKIKKKKKNIFIHSHNTLMSMACILNTNLFTVHDALYYQNKAINHKFKYIFYLLEKYLYTRVNFVHFISNFSKKMSLYSSSENFKIIYNTSYLESYTLNHSPKLNELSTIKFKPKNTKLFVVRGIEERSRIDLMINLAEKLKDTNHNILIAGKGPLFDFYTKQIRDLELKNIELLGYINDEAIINYYLACDIVMMPAEYAEGFGLPIIEGYLFNKPVIASNRCAIPEVIISEDFLFENTIESIIQKLEFAKSKLNESYKKFYEENFSNNHIINEFNTLYKSLM